MQAAFKKVRRFCLGVLMAFALAGWVDVSKVIKPQVVTETVQVPVEIEKPQKSPEELLDTVPKSYGVPREAIEVIYEKESVRGKYLSAFEANKLATALRITKDPNEAHQLATSHCELHVLGLTARDMGIHWSQLYDKETCFEAGVSIFARGMERHKSKPMDERIYLAFRDYNGSGPQAEQYAADAFKRFSAKIIREHFA